MTDVYKNLVHKQLIAELKAWRFARDQWKEKTIKSDNQLAAERAARERAERAIRTRPDYDLRCQECGAPHWLDTSLPSEIWNRIAKPEDILCLLCIDERLERAGIKTDQAEFYFVGRALQSKVYAESHGRVAEAERRAERAEARLAECLEALRYIRQRANDRDPDPMYDSLVIHDMHNRAAEALTSDGSAVHDKGGAK